MILEDVAMFLNSIIDKIVTVANVFIYLCSYVHILWVCVYFVKGFKLNSILLYITSDKVPYIARHLHGKQAKSEYK